MQKAMKKVSVFAVIILTLLMSLFCFTSCGEKGVYRLKTYKIGTSTTEMEWEKVSEGEEESYSFVELKKGNVARIEVMELFALLDVEGTWKRDGDNIIITQVTKNTNGSETTTKYTLGIDGDKLTLTTSGLLGEVKLTFVKL